MMLSKEETVGTHATRLSGQDGRALKTVELVYNRQKSKCAIKT